MQVDQAIDADQGDHEGDGVKPVQKAIDVDDDGALTRELLDLAPRLVVRVRYCDIRTEASDSAMRRA